MGQRIPLLYRKPKPPEARHNADSLYDFRFRGLMSQRDWAALPEPVQRRFSKRLDGGRTAVYVGEIVDTQISRAGWWLVQLARLIGGPFPTNVQDGGPSVVTVTEDAATGGQIWTRLYGSRRGFPQIIHSAKRFAGPTGLEEYVGRGVGMALTVHQEDGALVFRSAGYFCQLIRFRIALPAWAVPGALVVTHRELGEGRFSFELDVSHPRFGRLIRQKAAFKEIEQ